MKHRVTQVDTVPTARPQRTPPQTINQIWPTDTTGYHTNQTTQDDTTIGRHIPGTLGRFPTIGIDHGHINGTRPDQNDRIDP